MPVILLMLDFVPNQQRTFEDFLLRTARGLQAEGWQAVFVFAGEPGERVAADLHAAGATYHVCGFPLQRPAVDALIARLGTDPPLLMTTTFVSCFNAQLLRIKTKLRIRHWIVHDQSSGTASNKRGIKRWIARLRGWYVGRRIDRVLAVSAFVARRNVEQSYLPPARVAVLRNGVDVEHFRPAPPAVEPVEDRVVFVGQLIPEKGLRTLMTALQRLPDRPRFEVAGRGALAGELQIFAAAYGPERVHVRGQVADVRELYRGATVVVVPSEWAEAAAFVITEAMACGACLLVSDAGGNPDLVGRDNEGGRLFRAGDADDLATKLMALLKDPAAQARLRQQARERAERLFTLDAMVAGFLAAVREVNGSGRK